MMQRRFIGRANRVLEKFNWRLHAVVCEVGSVPRDTPSEAPGRVSPSAPTSVDDFPPLAEGQTRAASELKGSWNGKGCLRPLR